MTDKQKDISIALLVFTSTLVFALGMILWPYMPKGDKWLSKLYYLTTAATLYSLSLIIFIVARSKWWKISGCVGLSIFSINLYVELFLDPTRWTSWSGALIVVVALNLFLTVSIVEKIKAKSTWNN